MSIKDKIAYTDRTFVNLFESVEVCYNVIQICAQLIFAIHCMVNVAGF
jgi:hypothetical protein